jgi:peroxiredoxin
MKYLASVVALLIIFTACNKIETPVDKQITKIIGHITTPIDKHVVIAKDNPYDFDFIIDTLAIVPVDTAGNFTVTFPLKDIDLVQLKFGNRTVLWSLYVYPGDELKLDINNYNDEDLKFKFTGKSEKANLFSQAIANMYKQDDEYNKKLLAPDPADMVKYIDNRRKDMLSYYKDYWSKDTVPSFINLNEISNINFQWAYYRNEWALRNYYYYPEVWSKTQLPPDFWDFLKKLNFNEPYLHYFLERYLESLTWQWHKKQIEDGKTPTSQEMEKVKFEIAKAKFTGQSRDIAMALCLNGLLSYDFEQRMIEVTTQLMDDFKKNVSEKRYIPSIENKFKKRLSLLKGNPAPNFTLPNILEAPISLSDFKGKVVYIYFWGTIYPTSFDMVADFNDLQKKFIKNPNIVFVSIALENNNMRLWKQFVDENKPMGIQLYMEGEFSNPVAQNYMINSIPSYMLIDKDGKIIDVNAPSPRTKNIEEVLKIFSNK